MKTKIATLWCLLFAVTALNATVRTVNLTSFIGATNYSTITEALTASVSGDMVYVAAGTYAETELIIPAGVNVVGGLPANATVSLNRIYPGKGGITSAQKTIISGSAAHRVATVAGTLDGCVILNGKDATQGGGVLINTTGTVQNCFIRGNQCHNTANTGKGGGAYLQGNAKLINCVLDFNMAQQGFAVAGAGTAVNNTITNNCNAPTWIIITAGASNKFPYNDLTDNHSYDTWFTNDYYLAQTETTVAQYAVFANATLVPNSTTQKVFSVAERETKYKWNPSSVPSDVLGYNCLLFSENASGLQSLEDIWVANSGMESRPMPNVSWYGSLAYSQWIGGSLPTDAEWEFAARRTTTGYSNNRYSGTNLSVTTGSPGAQDYFWFGNNASLPSGNATSSQIVATKLPNDVGLYDMSGNVWEWCSTWYSNSLVYGVNPAEVLAGTGRVIRGGSWPNPSPILEVNYRYNFLFAPDYIGNSTGFRPKIQVGETPTPIVDLSSLTVMSSGTNIPILPSFYPSTLSYTAMVDYEVSVVTLTPSTLGTTRTIKVNGTSVSNGSPSGAISLMAGATNTITVVVNDNGSEKTYTVSITRSSNSNYLAGLSIKGVPGGAIVNTIPSFSSSTFTYTASSTNNVSITATLTDPSSTMTINGSLVASGVHENVLLVSGSNPISIVVTPTVGTQTTYTITITK